MPENNISFPQCLETICSEVDKAESASEEELHAFIESIFAPLSQEEIDDYTDEHTDPTQWQLPSHPFPPSYLDFLRWSNGGYFTYPNRIFDDFGLYPIDEMRMEMLSNYTLEDMPAVIPFGTDGGGVLYGFDMRRPPDEKGEYPILLFDPAAPYFNQASVIAHNFVEFMTYNGDLDDIEYEAPVGDPSKHGGTID